VICPHQELGGLSREIAEHLDLRKVKPHWAVSLNRHPAVWSVVLRKKPALAN